MDFSFSEEQQLLRDSVIRFIRQDYGFDIRQKTVTSSAPFNRDYWQTFAELGWLLVPFGEDDGGLGGSAVDIMVVMEEFGKGMVVEPLLASAILAGGLIAETGSAAQKNDWLQPLMDGQLQLAFAFAEPQSRFDLANVATRAEADGEHFVVRGHKTVVLNGGAADTLVVSVRSGTGVSLLAMDSNTPGITRNSYKTVDGHNAAEIYFDAVRVPRANLLGVEGKALPAIEKIIDRATLAICAEAVGAMESALQKTVEYTKTRKQFGTTISSFQALQHRMADMFIECQQARSILMMAAMQLDAGNGVAPRAVSAAKSRIGKAARKVGQEAVQIHGGIGVTDELDVAHLFKRLTSIQYLFGSTDYHTQRFIG
ncbi:acyl-CoA dehydrogenase family protein [Microbulbifer harenosus]|uniref:Pimeloyl-CoA dehydrogenase small subunit n=1 Tax=Microbulbifer harenosus TaxID=2576840 RepID=A0ABY2UF37_9GAMM|nr:acyl-CoA dehydrogenase [Microbulbifer harenosus]TLM76170.1 pimeloyl-CoA dehydrogenase small subunit [Microbulbifer harenosus]